jgi:hypothetical protein
MFTGKCFGFRFFQFLSTFVFVLFSGVISGKLFVTFSTLKRRTMCFHMLNFIPYLLIAFSTNVTNEVQLRLFYFTFYFFELMNERFLITVTKFIVNNFQLSLQIFNFRFDILTFRGVFCGQTFEKNDLQRRMDHCGMLNGGECVDF